MNIVRLLTRIEIISLEKIRNRAYLKEKFWQKKKEKGVL